MTFSASCCTVHIDFMVLEFSELGAALSGCEDESCGLIQAFKKFYFASPAVAGTSLTRGHPSFHALGFNRREF